MSKQISSISLFLFISILILACSPKTIKPIEDSSDQDNAPELANDPVGCETFNSLKPADKEEAQTAYVLFRDYLRLKEFDEAFAYWKKAMALAPAGNGKVKYQFDDGISFYKHYYSLEKDSIKKNEYAMKAMDLYDLRMECFGDEAYINGRKAFDLYYTFQGMASDEEIYNLFKSNIDLNDQKADYFVVNPFTKLMTDRLINEEIKMSEAQIYASKLFDIIDYGSTNCEGNLCEAWEIIKSYAPLRLEALEGFDGFYDCDYYTKKYYPIFKANPTDCESINLAYQRLRRGNCELNSPELEEIATAKKENCQEVSYTPGPLRLGYNAYDEGNYTLATEKFREFVDNTEDLEKKAKYTLLIAKIYYRDLKNFPKSRSLALEAASYKANWGEPFLLIGKLYASSGPLCGPGRGWIAK
jgi:hypothetical protein